MGVRKRVRKQYNVPKRVCNKQYNVPSLPEEIVVNVLNRLPQRSVARFNVVCKQWHTYISSSVRSLRWKSTPSTLGFLFHNHKNSLSTERQVLGYLTASIDELPSDFDISELVESIGCSMQERVLTALVSATTTKNILDGTSKNPKTVKKSAITRGSIMRIIASSKGVLLCMSSYEKASCFYVYNPYTEQVVLIPYPLSFILTDAVGFACFESPEAVDRLHYMIVCYSYSPSKAIIQTFSSQTGKWVNVHLPQFDDVPRLETLSADSNLPGVIVVMRNHDDEEREVFYWFEDTTRERIFAIDAKEGTYWFIEAPPPLPLPGLKLRDCFFGVSGDDGYLYFTKMEAKTEGDQLSLWSLKAVSGASNEMWVMKYIQQDFVKLAMENCSKDNNDYFLERCRGSIEMVNLIQVIGIDPASPNVVYVKMLLDILSFDFQSREVRLLDILDEDDDVFFKTYMHEWYQWPRLLPPLPTLAD